MQAVKFALLGLLAKESRHGYELKTAFEELLGGSINVGQVYTTLQRLERDDFVRSELIPQDLVPDRKVYDITPAGRAELDAWLNEPTAGPIRLRDELFVKVLIADLVDSTDVHLLITRQRQRHLQTMSELNALLATEELNRPARLIVEGAVLHAEADLRWLSLVEDALMKVENG
ncbi:MAG: PadR family transcriptional regulator [Actinomycetota bacterium]